MRPETTIEDARRLLSVAVTELPQLTTFGIGLYFSYYRQGTDAVALGIQKQQAELGTEHSLQMVAFCGDWIAGHHEEIQPHRSSYFYKHVVEQWRRDNGDPDPYIHNGCFIAAAVGLKLGYKIDGPNAFFRFPSLRERINTALYADGQELRGNKIIQVFLEECPWVMLGSPYVIEDDVDLDTLARELGVV